MTESLENYLETILILSHEIPVVRSIDITRKLDFKRSSVSVAMKTLKEEGYITVDESGFISLTELGHKIACDIYGRHKLLSEWLIKLGVPEDVALKDACKIEHIISPESVEAIKKFIDRKYI